MLPVLKPGVWQALTDPASDAYHPLLPPLIQFEAVANVLLVVLAVVTAICFFAKKRSAPRVFIAFLGLSLAVQAVDWGWAAQLPARFQADEAGSWKELAKAGCLLSYGPNIIEYSQRSAAQIDKIFKGALVGELPVEQMTRFELVVNLSTAAKLGITMPQSILLRADDVLP